MPAQVSIVNAGRTAIITLTAELTAEETLRLLETLARLGRRYYHCEHLSLNIDAKGDAWSMAPALMDELDQFRADGGAVSAQVFKSAIGVPAALFAYADVGRRNMREDAQLRLSAVGSIGFAPAAAFGRSTVEREVLERLLRHCRVSDVQPGIPAGIISSARAYRLGLADPIKRSEQRLSPSTAKL